MKPYIDLSEQDKIIEIFKQALTMAEIKSGLVAFAEDGDPFNAVYKFYFDMGEDIENKLKGLGVEGILEPKERF